MKPFESCYVCPGCGEKFRLWYSFKKHLSSCFYYKCGDRDGKQEDSV